jgi:hypothetical protein
VQVFLLITETDKYYFLPFWFRIGDTNEFEADPLGKIPEKLKGD